MGTSTCLLTPGFEEREREGERKKINNDSIILKFENRIWFI